MRKNYKKLIGKKTQIYLHNHRTTENVVILSASCKAITIAFTDGRIAGWQQTYKPRKGHWMYFDYELLLD